MEQAIQRMCAEIYGILGEEDPSVYLTGSVTLNDFHLGWSDIDLLVLTKEEIPLEKAEKLVNLRQRLQAQEPENPYYRAFEGGMLCLAAFCTGQPGRVVYWGTSGERITDTYRFDSFSMAELLKNGRLCAGCDVREGLRQPEYRELRQDVTRHFQTIRQHAATTGRSLYSFGWLLDIARGIYTLQTGKIISKTEAGYWALRQGICPVERALRAALLVRENPMKYKNDEAMMELAETLGPEVQKFADVLERELAAAEGKESKT